MSAPEGLNLRPNPPAATRVKRQVGILATVIAGLLIGLIIYGIASRRTAFASRQEKDSVTGASDAGRRLLAGSHPPHVSAAPPPAITMPQAAEPPAVTANAAPRYTAPPPPPPVEPPQQQPQADPEVAAMAAPSAVQWTSGGAGSQALAAGDQLLGRIPPGQPPAHNDLAGAGQDDKQRFLSDARKEPPAPATYAPRLPPASRYVVAAGWRIPAALEGEIISDLPGEASALVTVNVFDTLSGQYLLIPQGSRLIGSYNSRIGYGQERAQVVWSRLVFPDASSTDLGGVNGTSPSGAVGFHDKVDNHYRRIVGYALLTSAFSAAFALSQSRRGTVLGYPSAAEVAGTAAAQELTQLGTEITRRNLNIQPSIKIRSGYRFDVMVARDLVFEGPYRPNSSIR